jgi:hypothetical protein
VDPLAPVAVVAGEGALLRLLKEPTHPLASPIAVQAVVLRLPSIKPQQTVQEFSLVAHALTLQPMLVVAAGVLEAPVITMKAPTRDVVELVHRVTLRALLSFMREVAELLGRSGEARAQQMPVAVELVALAKMDSLLSDLKMQREVSPTTLVAALAVHQLSLMFRKEQVLR